MDWEFPNRHLNGRSLGAIIVYICSKNKNGFIGASLCQACSFSSDLPLLEKRIYSKDEISFFMQQDTSYQVRVEKNESIIMASKPFGYGIGFSRVE